MDVKATVGTLVKLEATHSIKSRWNLGICLQRNTLTSVSHCPFHIPFLLNILSSLFMYFSVLSLTPSLHKGCLDAGEGLLFQET